MKKCGPVVKSNWMTANIQANFSSFFLHFIMFNMTRKHRMERLILLFIHENVQYMCESCLFSTEKTNRTFAQHGIDWTICVSVGWIWKSTDFYRSVIFGDSWSQAIKKQVWREIQMVAKTKISNQTIRHAKLNFTRNGIL